MSAIAENPRNIAIAPCIGLAHYSLPFLGVAIFVFATSFPPFDYFTEISLSAHMLQHVLIVIGGVVISYPLYKKGRFGQFKSKRNALLGFAVLSGLVIFWHLPVNWDAAVASFWTHILEHVCFLIVGLLVGAVVPMFNDSTKLLISLLAISGHMFYGFTLYVTPTPIYPLYPVSQQAELGLLLFAPSPIYVIAYLYFNLTRESRKLEQQVENRQLVSRKSRLRGHVLLVAVAIVLLASIGLYYGATFVIISQANHVSPAKTSIVYIEEGPVYWQYTPQNIIVVIGVNNSVEWVSHSFTLDTVTSVNGTFNSGPLSPGQTFSYTFSTAGVYRYYCEYHLWMTGIVTVLPPSS